MCTGLMKNFKLPKVRRKEMNPSRLLRVSLPFPAGAISLCLNEPWNMFVLGSLWG